MPPLSAEELDRMTQSPLPEAQPGGKADRGDELPPEDATPSEDATPPEDATLSEDEELPRDPNTGKFIPKARFDEMSARSRQALDRANARIAELEGQVTQNQGLELTEVDAELDKLEQQYTKLLIDGEIDEAAKLRSQIRGIERRYAAAQAAAMATGTREQVVDSVKLDDVISQLEENFPFLNPQDETYNDDIAQEILDLHEGLVAKGWPRSTAMQRAASYVLNSLDIEIEQEEPTAPAPKGAAPPRDADRRAAVKRGLEAISRQPPLPTGKAGDVGSPRQLPPGDALAKMSQSDFEKLTPEQLRKLRGDDFDE